MRKKSQSGKDKHCRNRIKKLEDIKIPEAKNDETVIHAYDEKYKELREKFEKISDEVKTLKENNHMVQLKKQNFIEEKFSKVNYKDVVFDTDYILLTDSKGKNITTDKLAKGCCI